MANFTAGFFTIILAIILVGAVFAALGWAVSVLVTFLFGIDFGFLQALAAVILAWIGSHIVFSGARK